MLHSVLLLTWGVDAQWQGELQYILLLPQDTI
jgi:hypothetical protein